MKSSLATILVFLLVFSLVSQARADPFDETVRQLIGWGWQDARHGQSLASDILGQFVDSDPARPSFGSYGPYGGANDHGFFLFTYGSGSRWCPSGLAAHTGIGKLAVPDYWNHRVLLFDLKPDGSLASRRASGLVGQERFDQMEIGRGPDRFNYPATCAFDPAGRFLFVADQFNHRVLQFDMRSPRRAVRVYGQGDFDAWGYDGTSPPRALTAKIVLPPQTNARGMFFPRGVACDGKRLFVSDNANHRVLIFDCEGAENGPEAVHVLGQADLTQHEANRGGAVGLETMRFPSALALDEKNQHLIVADSANRRALVFDISGEIKNGMPAVAAAALPAGPKLYGENERWLMNGALSVAMGPSGQMFLTDREGTRVLAYDLNEVLAGSATPRAAIGQFEMMTDLIQAETDNGGPTGLTTAGRFLYVVEPRGNRVLCYDTSDPDTRAVNVLGQTYGNDVNRTDYRKYGANNGPDPYGFDFADGVPALSVTDDGKWLMAADSIGGRLLFFPLGTNGLPLDRSARLVVGVPTFTTRINKANAEHFARPGHAVLTDAGDLFVTDFSGSRILQFELPNLVATTGKRSLGPLRPFVPPTDRPPFDHEDFEFRSIENGVRASHVLGQKDFEAGLRGVASISQLGKQMSGLALDRERGWLIVAEMMNHRVVIFDISKGVSNFMPAIAALGQPDFDHNDPNWGQGNMKNLVWHPRGMVQPRAVRYDQATKRLFVVNGREGADREILCFDLSGKITNGMEPAMRIGGPHATVKTDLPEIGDWMALDEQRHRLWSGLYALDISDLGKGAPVIGHFGEPKKPPQASPDTASRPASTNPSTAPSGRNPNRNRLGYVVESCNRFDSAVDALGVNPRTGTVYVADNQRYRVLCFQPEFHFDTKPLKLTIGQPAVGLTGTGGLSPLQFTVDDKAIPAGLHVDPETGTITGTPSDKPGEYLLKVTVKTGLGAVTGARTVVLVK
jgi:DNA-binding beta-propeller fold protein YncE